MVKSLILSLCIFSVATLSAQTVSEQTKRKQQIEEEIAYLDKQLANTKSKQQANTKELNFIQRKITNRKKLLKELEGEINYIDGQVAIKESEIRELNRNLIILKKNYSDLIYNSYKTRDRNIWFLYILASDNLEQGYRRWSYIKNYTGAIKKIATDIKTKKENISKEQEELTKSFF